MAPTPNQLMIQQDPSLIQAPQVQEQIAGTQVVKEGEVSMPSPREWIGNIDYGVDWYKLGEQAFAAAGSIYEDTLKYSINKKTAQLRDLQYDYQTKMRNEFAASVDPNPTNYVEPREEAVDFNRPFSTSNYFQETFRKQANEIIGFKDSDGNVLDVFADDEYDAQGNLVKKGFNFDGFGSAWFNVVETARSGLYDISRDAEKVQSDLLKSFNERFKKANTFTNWANGKYTSNTDNEVIAKDQYPRRNGLEPVNAVIEAIGPQSINMEVKTATGGSTLIPTPNGGVIINPEATDEDLIKTLGITGYSLLTEMDAQVAHSARGINLPHKFAERTRTILQSDNISVADAVWLKSNLKYMPQEKIKHLFEIGENFKPLEKAKLMVALSYAGYPGREDVTPETFIQKINNIKTPQANQLQALISNLTKDLPVLEMDRPTSGPILDAKVSSKSILHSLLGAVNENGEIINPTLYENINTDSWFNAYVNNNPSIQPPLFTALLELQTLRINNPNISQEEATKQITQTLNSVVLMDDAGVPIVVRNSLFGSLGQKPLNGETKPTGYYGSIINNAIVQSKQGVLIDPTVLERFNNMSPTSMAFVTMSLNDNIDERDYDSLIESVDRQFVPIEDKISVETKKKILQSIVSVSNNQDGQNTGSTPRLSDALRVLVSTNPSVIKSFNNGVAPSTEKQALEIAGRVYDRIGPAELWDWKFTYSSADDQLINSKDGGIPFNLNGINYKNEIGETINLLDNRMVMTQSNRGNIRFSDSSNSIPYTMLPNRSLLPENFEEGYRNAERLLVGQRPSVLELDLGTNPTTNKSNNGLVSAAQMLGATNNNKRDLYQPVIDVISQEELADYIIPITEHQARVSGKDPEVISRVSDLLSKVYDKPKQVYFSALREVVANEDLFNYIVTADSDNDGQITKLDIINNMHIAAVGYNLNTTFKEETKDNYPKIQESVFWENALQTEKERPYFSYTGSSLKQEEAESFIMSQLDQWYMDGLLGAEEIANLYPQITDAVKRAVSTDIPEALKDIKDVLEETFKKDLPEATDEFVNTVGQMLKATTQTIVPIDLLMDTEYKSIWKQITEADILRKPIDTGVNFNTKGMFGIPKTLDEVNNYVERFGELPPNISKQQYQDLGGTISEELIYDSSKKRDLGSYPIESDGTIKIPLTESQKQQTSPGAVSDKPYMKLIEEFEGLKTEAYWDSTGKVWTIGQGTTTYPNGKPVKKGDKITKEQAREYAETFVNDVVIPRLQETIPTWNEMTPNQQAALISFSYNAGQNFYGREKYKTLSKVLSSVDTFDKVPATLLLYNTSGGQKLKGLVRRRKAEAALWSK